MPRPRRQSRARRPDLLSPAMLRWLRSGNDFLGEVEHLPESELRQAWTDAGPEIMPAHIAEHPGTRPYGWWRFSAPERRRCINGTHPFDDPRHKAYVVAWRSRYPEVADAHAHRLHYGMPATLIPGIGFDAEYEPEADYLRRLGLLTPEERKALADLPDDE